MPDAANVLVEVGLAPNVDGEVFHLPGVAHTTARAFFETAIAIARSGAVSAMPARLVRIAGVVYPLARWFADILHLWEDPILLDGSKLRAWFPAVAMTSYDDGIAATLAWHRAHADARVY